MRLKAEISKNFWDLSNIHASRLPLALGLLTAAAMEEWMESLR